MLMMEKTVVSFQEFKGTFSLTEEVITVALQGRKFASPVVFGYFVDMPHYRIIISLPGTNLLAVIKITSVHPQLSAILI